MGEERFSLTGKKVTEPGFTAVISWQAVPAEESLPQLNQGDRLTVKEVRKKLKTIAIRNGKHLGDFPGWNRIGVLLPSRPTNTHYIGEHHLRCRYNSI